MTKENREKLSKHFRKLGVENPYKKEKKTLAPLPTIDPEQNPDSKGNATKEDKND